MYQKSLGINVNLIMGLLMLVFGLIMLYFARRKKKA
jgi:LPXTG-motif cell wall-anchored protein